MKVFLLLFLLPSALTGLVLVRAILADRRERDAEIVRVLYQLADEGARLLQAERTRRPHGGAR